MATAVRERVAELCRLLEPRPGRVEFAARVALICALSALVAEIYQTPSPALTIYVALFMNRPDRTSSVLAGVALVAVMSAVLGLVLLVAMAVLDDPMWRVASIAALSLGFLFLASASRLRTVGGTVALIAGYALDLLGSVPVGELATRALLYTWLFVGIPAGVSIAVNLLFAPAPRRRAEQALVWRLELTAAMLRGPGAGVRERFTEALREGTAQIQTWLRLAGVERTASPQDLAALRQAADSAVVLLAAVDVLDRHADAALTPARLEPIARLVDEMAAILRAGAYPVEVAWPELGAEVAPGPLAARVLADLRGALERFAEAPAVVAPPHAAAEPAHGFLEADAFTNPDHLRYALKATAAALFCYLLYTQLDWRGIHTCFITCYIVSLGTAAETVEKLALRVGGCLLGALVGWAAILFLLPLLTSIGSLMLLVYAGAFAAAWVAGGSPRIAYAGFQIAFAFFLCVVQGSGPEFDLVVARDRVLGILLGNVVSFLIFTNVWPVSVARRIDPALAALLRRLSALARIPSLEARRAPAAEAQAALASLETDLHLLAYEPAGLQPALAWQRARATALRELGALEAPLLLGGDEGSAARLEQIATALDAPAARGPQPEPSPLSATASLLALIERHLQGLERALGPREHHALG